MAEDDSYYRAQAQECFQEAYQKQVSGEIDKAIELYRRSLELYPTAEAHTFLGWAYSFHGHYDDAIKECRKAIKVDPEYGNPYNDIGAYLIEKGRPEEAVSWLQKATLAKRYDAYCYPHYNLGRVWEKQGQWQKALLSYQKALDFNPDYKLARKAQARLQGIMN